MDTEQTIEVTFMARHGGEQTLKKQTHAHITEWSFDPLDGYLRLFRVRDLVAVYAPGHWRGARVVPATAETAESREEIDTTTPRLKPA